MIVLQQLLLPFLWSLSLFPTYTLSKHNPLRVQTTGGTVLGLINGTTPNVRQFLSVPYAQPPLGELRFAPPAKLNDPSPVIDATQFGVACPQVKATGINLQTYITQLAFHGTTGEDCLTLALWAPTNSTGQKLPVFVWLYGGGYDTGGIDTLYQLPGPWVERTQSHIVISANTRVNFFGYPGARGLEYNNSGLLDQRAVVEWAVENVANFGGDPDKIKLWGQSSGAGSVDLYNFAYYNDPIVTGFISDSGSVFLNNQVEDPNFTNFTYVADHFDCSSSDAAEQLACMRDPNITSDAIIELLTNNASSTHFIPFVDNISIFPNYTDRYALGAISNRPAIFGNNLREGFYVAPFPADPYTEEPNVTLANMITFEAFDCPAYYSAMQRDKLGLKTYRYQYRGNFSNISPFWWAGAYHATELPLLFGTYPLYRSRGSPFEAATSEIMQNLWLAFARDPENGPTSVGGWTSFSQGGYVEVFGDGNDAGGITHHLVPHAPIDAGCTAAIWADVLDGVNPF